MNNYSAALAAMRAAVREHCPGLPAFTVKLYFEDADGCNTFSSDHPAGPPVFHDARTGVISARVRPEACTADCRWPECTCGVEGLGDA